LGNKAIPNHLKKIIFLFSTANNSEKGYRIKNVRGCPYKTHLEAHLA